MLTRPTMTPLKHGTGKHFTALDNLSSHQTTDYHTTRLRLLRRATVGLASHSSADIDTQGEGREFGVCVYIYDRSSGSVCALQGPWADRDKEGQTSGILSHLPWVGSRT